MLVRVCLTVPFAEQIIPASSCISIDIRSQNAVYIPETLCTSIVVLSQRYYLETKMSLDRYTLFFTHKGRFYETI